MPLFLCDRIGDGSDAEGNDFRPTLAEYPGSWACVCDGRTGLMLVRAEHQVAFDSDARIRPMRRAMLGNLAPDDGETDDWEADDLATKIARRFLLRQCLGAVDFGSNLDLTLGDLSAARRSAIRNRLTGRGIDISGLALSTSVADAMRFILPQFKVQLGPRRISPSGTFTDDFDGEASTINMEDRTPSGGTAWTRVDGTAGMGTVTTAGKASCATTDSSGALFQCDDQGDVDHYVQFVVSTTNMGPMVCNRASDRSNYVSMRARSTSGFNAQLFVRNAGTITTLASNTDTSNLGDVLRLESSGDAQEVFVNAGSVISGINESHNNTVTRQGVNQRLESGDTIDDFEAGVLAAGGTILPQVMQHYYG